MWVLAPSVAVIPSSELPARGDTDHAEGDHEVVELVTGDSNVVDATTAELLRQLRVPRRLDEAVAETCKRTGDDPDDLLDQARPLVDELVSMGVIVDEAADDARTLGLAAQADRFVDQTLANIDARKPHRHPPEAAQIAYALHRISIARRDDRLSSWARLWLAAAPDATGPLLEGIVSPDYVRAVMRDDDVIAELAIARFVATAEPGANALIACRRALGFLPSSPARSAAIERGTRVMVDLVGELASRPVVTEDRRSLGFAHGWAGELYAILAWCDATARPVPAAIVTRLDELAACAEPASRGVRWEWRSAMPVPHWLFRCTPGWCNGSAGFVYLWTLAARLLDDNDGRYRQLAEAAGWNAWQERWTNGSVCCGLAGQAFALAHLAAHSHDNAWLERARGLCGAAAVRTAAALDATSPFHAMDRIEQFGLFRGDLGVAVLAAELARDPASATFPLFA